MATGTEELIKYKVVNFNNLLYLYNKFVISFFYNRKCYFSITANIKSVIKKLVATQKATIVATTEII